MPDLDSLVDELVCLRGLLGDGVNGTLEDVSFPLRQSVLLILRRIQVSTGWDGVLAPNLTTATVSDPFTAAVPTEVGRSRLLNVRLCPVVR